MTWRPYAAGVAISAGVFVTGVLWWERANPHIAAEDVAAIAADVYRLGMVVSYEGGPPSNRVSTTRSRQVLVDVADDLFDVAFSTTGRPLWLRDECDWDTGDNIMSTTYAPWVMSSSNGGDQALMVWTKGAITNIEPLFVTLSTRHVETNNGVQMFYGAPSHHYPGVTSLAFDYITPTWDDGWLAGYRPYGDCGNWWTANGFGTNVYVYPYLTRAGTSGTTTPVYTISTNALNGLRLIMSNMHTAVLLSSMYKVVGYEDVWACSNAVRKIGYASCDSVSVTNDAAEAAVFSDLQADAISSISTDEVSFPGNGTWSLGYLNFTWDFTYDYDYDKRTYSELQAIEGWYTWEYPWALAPETDGPHMSVSGTLNGGVTKYNGVYCTWPPQSAYDSGMITRVRYYLVMQNRGSYVFGYGPIDPPPPSYNPTYYATPASYNMYTEDYFGTGYTMSPQGPDITLASTKAVKNSATGYTSLDLPAQMIVNKIADVPNPTKAPRVDIGVDDLAGLFGSVTIDGARENSWYEHAYRDNIDETYYSIIYKSHETARQFQAEVPSAEIASLICVVDVQPTHYTDGGLGEEYTPPWATNAPPYTP